jgi:catechol 2,3-dioxygenase-like lactoylglutathione lyase family enzyme
VKRLHVHVAVDELEQSVRFYSNLFGASPTVLKSDYAKWMLEDPRVNFAISSRGRKPGLDHLGVQVEDSAELAEAYGRLKSAERPVLEQGAMTCCYAKSEKAWVQDPSGIAWETFLTRGESTTYGEEAPKSENACCTPDLDRVPGLAPTTPVGP